MREQAREPGEEDAVRSVFDRRPDWFEHDLGLGLAGEHGPSLPLEDPLLHEPGGDLDREVVDPHVAVGIPHPEGPVAVHRLTVQLGQRRDQADLLKGLPDGRLAGVLAGVFEAPDRAELGLGPHVLAGLVDPAHPEGAGSPEERQGHGPAAAHLVEDPGIVPLGAQAVLQGAEPALELDVPDVGGHPVHFDIPAPPLFGGDRVQKLLEHVHLTLTQVHLRRESTLSTPPILSSSVRQNRHPLLPHSPSSITLSIYACRSHTRL